MILFVKKFQITVYGMEHQQATESSDEIGQKVPVIANSICSKVMLNQFNGDGIDNGNDEGNDSDFIE